MYPDGTEFRNIRIAANDNVRADDTQMTGNRRGSVSVGARPRISR